MYENIIYKKIMFSFSIFIYIYIWFIIFKWLFNIFAIYLFS